MLASSALRCKLRTGPQRVKNWLHYGVWIIVLERRRTLTHTRALILIKYGTVCNFAAPRTPALTHHVCFQWALARARHSTARPTYLCVQISPGRNFGTIRGACSAASGDCIQSPSLQTQFALAGWLAGWRPTAATGAAWMSFCAPDFNCIALGALRTHLKLLTASHANRLELVAMGIYFCYMW